MNQPLFCWHGVRDSEPTPRPFALLRGELVKLLSAPCGRFKAEDFILVCSLNGGLTPNTIPTKKGLSQKLFRKRMTQPFAIQSYKFMLK